MTNWRVIALVILLIFAYFAINGGITPRFWDDGVTIRSVLYNSSAARAGMENPSPKLTPLAKEKIIAVNGKSVTSTVDYYQTIQTIKANQTVKLDTSRRSYLLTTTSPDLGLKVYDAPTNNIRKGLDLEGGTRVVLKPAEAVSENDLALIIDNLQERLNVYGLSDVVIRASSDLAGEKYIVIEIAGVTEEEVKELLARQGKFEAKIGNETIFLGGKKDITYVCRSADCSGIDPNRGCGKAAGGYGCSFFFGITLSQEAAQRQAALTKDLAVIDDDNGRHLSEELVLYLDDKEVDRLKISAELKGQASTNIQITGGGSGTGQQQAMTNTLQNMKKLQTIITTGSLPVKMEIVKIDTISPSLGKEFMVNVLLVGALAILSVIVVVLVRYRRIKVVLPMAFIMVSEMVLILGFAALVGWNLDLASIAGIIIVAGTGVDHLIVITDETLHGEVVSDWKRRIKNAMFIVMGAFSTVLASMLPLWFAGAGLLKGFAFTTIVGLSFGVLIARPAYAAIIEVLLKD